MENEQRHEWLSWLKIILVCLVVVLGVRTFLFTPVAVSGASMMPTLENGDKLFVSKVSNIERFDVVIFKATEESNYVKRVIGMPGDQVEYHDDKLYVNGKAYEEPYLEDLKAELHGIGKLTGSFTLEDILNEQVVPAGHYFVLGDNRQYSRDSRDAYGVGFVSEEQLIGKAQFVFLPFEHIGGLGE